MLFSSTRALAGLALAAAVLPQGQNVFLGIVEAPSLGLAPALGGAPGPMSPPARPSLAVRARPEPSAVVRVGGGAEQFSTSEFEAEVHGLEVWAEVAGFFGVREASGALVWVARADVGRFHPLDELLAGLVDLPSGTLVWPTPPPHKDRVAVELRQDQSVRLAATRRVGMVTWQQVEAIGDPCGEAEVEQVDAPTDTTGPSLPFAKGWIRAFGPTGRPTLRWHPRGC